MSSRSNTTPPVTPIRNRLTELLRARSLDAEGTLNRARSSPGAEPRGFRFPCFGVADYPTQTQRSDRPQPQYTGPTLSVLRCRGDVRREGQRRNVKQMVYTADRQAWGRAWTCSECGRLCTTVINRHVAKIQPTGRLRLRDATDCCDGCGPGRGAPFAFAQGMLPKLRRRRRGEIPMWRLAQVISGVIGWKRGVHAPRIH